MIVPRELKRIENVMEESNCAAGCDADAGTIHELREAVKILLREFREDQSFIEILEHETTALRDQRARLKRANEMMLRDDECRESVRWFAVEMEKKLREHDDRPGWENDEPGDLFDRLVEEAGELRATLPPMSPEQSKLTIDEAADVANFAMMIADNERRLVERCIRGPRGKEIGE